MLKEVKNMLWRGSAVSLGAALPLVLVGRVVMAGLLFIGIFLGLMATKGDSIRVTTRLLLNSWAVAGVVAFLIAMLVSAWFGIAPAVSLDKWLQVCGIALASGLLFMVLREMPGRYVDIMMKSLAVATYLMCALAVADAMAGYERLSRALHDADKFYSPYRLNFFSSVLAVLLPLVWARLLVKAREFEPFAQRVVWPAVGFGIFTLLICGGRAGWVAAIASFIGFWYVVMHWHNVVLHARHWLGLVAWLGAAIAAYGWMHGMGFLEQRMMLASDATSRGALSGRSDIWAQVMGWIPDNWLLGIGPMAYRQIPGALDAHPHNWFLQLLLETGLVGTAIFCGLMLFVLWRFWGLAQAGIFGVGALASLGAFLVAGLANTSIFNAWWLGFLPVIILMGWRVGWAPSDGRRRGRPRVVKRADLLKGGHGSR